MGSAESPAASLTQPIVADVEVDKPGRTFPRRQRLDHRRSDPAIGESEPRERAVRKGLEHVERGCGTQVVSGKFQASQAGRRRG